MFALPKTPVECLAVTFCLVTVISFLYQYFSL